MTSIPADSMLHIEDVGHLLLEAQKDLARVRQRLEAMPLETSAQHQHQPSHHPHHANGSASSSDTLDSLRDLLSKTESQLRQKAEAVLKSVEETRIMTQPVVNGVTNMSMNGGMMNRTIPQQQLSSQKLMMSSYEGDYEEDRLLMNEYTNGGSETSLIPVPSQHRRSSSPQPSRKSLQAQLHYLRRPVAERMQEQRGMEMLARPIESSNVQANGLAREYLQKKYGLGSTSNIATAASPNSSTQPLIATSSPLPSYTHSTSTGRPISRYGRTWRDQKIQRGSRISPAILAKSYRNNPGLFPQITTAETEHGVLGLVQKGYIPSFVDVSPAFNSSPPPLTQQPVKFYAYQEQFQGKTLNNSANLTSNGTTNGSSSSKHHHLISTNERFNLSHVRLDLSEQICEPQQEEKTQSNYPMLRPGSSHQQQKKGANGIQAQITSTTSNNNGLGGTILPRSTFHFPQLMPSDSELARKELHDRIFTTEGDDGDLEPIDKLMEEQKEMRMVLAGGQSLPPSDHLDLPSTSAAPRDYDELLDTYSLHQFLIRKGKTLSSTPEFISFQRKYQSIWGAIKQVLRELERICREYRLGLVKIHGVKVVEIAENELEKWTVEKMFQCFVYDDGISQLQHKENGTLVTTKSHHSQLDPFLLTLLLAPRKARYLMGGPIARTLATVKIQATWRMCLQRRMYLMFKHRNKNALVIQTQWRRFIQILRTRETIARRWEIRHQHWLTNIQTQWKKTYRTSFLKRKRVLIHIPSDSCELYQREKKHNYSVRTNVEMIAKLCQVADEEGSDNIDILYITSYPLPSDITSYIYKLLEIGGVLNAAARVKILSPENAGVFQESMSLSRLILYSPKLLKKMKDFVRGRPCCVITGHEVGREDLQVCVELGVPLYSALPDTSALFSSKSGSKRIFASAEVYVPPGAHDLYEEHDFYSYLGKLIIDHLYINKWIMKIDNESGGRGIACLDVSTFRVVQALREEKLQHAARWNLPEITANAQERVIVALKKSLSRKITLAQPALYNGKWEEYASVFFRIGGVIEAVPLHVIGSPSVNILIEPDGTCSITSTHDQIFSTPYVFAGANFPSSAPADLLAPSALSIGRACFQEGIIGYIGVDFVAYTEGGSSGVGIPKVWAVDLNLRMTHTQASFQLAHFLMKGRFVSASTNERGASEKDLPVHMRSPAKYLVSSVPANQMASQTQLLQQQQQSARSSSRTGLTSNASASPSTFMFSSSSSASMNNTSRPTSGGTRLPGIQPKHGSSSTSSLTPQKEEARYYSTIPYIYQPHLSTLQFNSLFNLCRQRSIAYDIRARTGTVFTLMDSLASGSLGVLCIGESQPGRKSMNVAASSTASPPPSPLHSMQLLVETLSFLNDQLSNLRHGTHLYDSESNLVLMLQVYKSLVKVQKEANQFVVEQQMHQQQQQEQGEI